MICFACRLVDEERVQGKDAVANNEIINDLRAALDVERSNALELEGRLEQEQKQFRKAKSELQNVSQQLNVQQTLTANLQQKIDQLMVS